MATNPPANPSPGGFASNGPMYPPYRWRRLSDLIADGEYVVDSEEWFPEMVYLIECRSAAVLHVSCADVQATPGDTKLVPLPFDAKDKWLGRFTRLDHSASTITSNDDIWLAFQT